MAKSTLKQMLVQCAKKLPPETESEILTSQNKSLYDVVHELVRQVTSPNTLVRDQVIAQYNKKKFEHWEIECIKKHKDNCLSLLTFDTWKG